MSLPLRPNVCLIVWKKPGLFLLAERIHFPGIWQFPQGGIEEGFSLEENAFRELEEEIAVARTSARITAQLKVTNDYLFDVTPPFAVGKWAGQTQKYFLIEFLGSESEIKFDNHHEPEFTAHRWCTIDEVQKIAEPRRLSGYNKALAEVAEILGLRAYLKP